jgi:membrane protein YqaA with SNARE-associated domain
MIMIFLITFLLELLPQYVTPHIFLIEAKILGFSLIPLLGVLIMASFFGSIAGFEIGRKYGVKVVDRLYGNKEEHKLKKLVKKHGKWIIALAAVSPLPYIPIIFGSIGIKRENFLTYGILSRIAGLIVFALFISLF